VAALLASNCQVPLTSVLLLFELTRDYLIILPTLAAVGIRWGHRLPIYGL
jgi:H+/Cl- antiporter ClcA